MQSLIERGKHSSSWTKATKANNKFKGINCKQQETFSVGDMRGAKCVKFPGFTKEELSNEALIAEIKVLGLAQDLNPNSNTVVRATFCQGKIHNNNTIYDDHD